MIRVRRLIAACNFTGQVCFMMWCINGSNAHRGPIERVVLMARTLPCMDIGRFEYQWQMDLNVQLARISVKSLYIIVCIFKTLLRR